MSTNQETTRAHFELQPELKEIGRLLSEFQTYATRNALPEEITQKLCIALDELVNNIISYGYDNADNQDPILIEMTIEGRTLIVTLTDSGIPFNPFASEAPDTTLSLAERKIGGLGIHFVQNLMTEVQYSRKKNRNIVTLRKQLDAGVSA
jgi:anti-sigma regulatory factor (Ser/Thr protein kinase)